MSELLGQVPSTQPLSPYATLYLIRHGETQLNATGVLQGAKVDYPLNAVGHRQAQLLGERFAATQLDLVVSSEMLRAKETAQQIQRHHPSLISMTMPRLAEISWGDYDGQAQVDLSALMDCWDQGEFDARPPGGESAADVEERALPDLLQLLREHGGNGQQIAIVIHGRLLRVILASLLDGTLHRMNIYNHANTCINTLRVYHNTTLADVPRQFGEPSTARHTLAEFHFEAVRLDERDHLDALEEHKLT